MGVKEILEKGKMGREEIVTLLEAEGEEKKHDRTEGKERKEGKEGKERKDRKDRKERKERK